MRIVFLATSSLDDPSPRGRWLPVAQQLALRGHRPQLLMLHPTYDRLVRREAVIGGVLTRYVAQMHVYGPPGARRYYRPLALLAVAMRGALSLAAAALAARPDVVHICKPQPISGLAGLIAAGRGAQLYLDCDDYEAGANRFGAAWQRRGVTLWEDHLPRLARAVSVNTRFLARRVEAGGVPPRRVCYVPNGVVAQRLVRHDARQRAALRAGLGLGDAPTAAYVGAMSTVAHGTALLLDAFAQLLRQLPRARLLMVGDGDDRSALQRRAADLGLADAIVWTGRVAPAAARALLECADVSVDPVEDTPGAAARSPLKIVESMALGVPVVTGDVGDRGEMLGQTAGITVLPGDAAALALGLAAVLSDPQRRAALTAGAELRAEHYTWERLIGGWENQYA